MQNCTFFVLLRPIFGEKLKTAPPPKENWVPKLWSTCRDSAWKSVLISNFGQKISPNSAKTFFWGGTTCFWAEKTFEFPILAKKSVSISVKDFFFFFFWRPPGIGRKKRLDFRGFREILIQEQWKFGSRSFALFTLFQKSPPPPLFQILATRLLCCHPFYHWRHFNRGMGCPSSALAMPMISACQFVSFCYLENNIVFKLD